MISGLRTLIHNTFSMFPFAIYRCPKCGYESTKGPGPGIFGICKEGRDCQFKCEISTMVGPENASRNVIWSNFSGFLFLVFFFGIVLFGALSRPY